MKDAPEIPAQAIEPSLWDGLRRFTAARIALGHTGTSLPTAPHLAFQCAHAQARDAVHVGLDIPPIEAAAAQRGWTVLKVHSAAADRLIYLQRPDLGRQLAQGSRDLLRQHGGACDVLFVLADGLSARAIQKHALPLLDALQPALDGESWRLGPLVVAEQGRVAIGDEIGALLGARLVVVMIGERPGLSAHDSLGIYLSYSPRVGLANSDRNCISNVRPEGLSYAQAAHTLRYLMHESLRRQLSGTLLKDEGGEVARAEVSTTVSAWALDCPSRTAPPRSD